jgi:molybdopterin synthase sulfur carrier subunit
VARISFTEHLQQHLSAPALEVAGATVREALDAVFATNPRLKGYVVDDQGRLRQHVVIFIDGQMIRDRVAMTDEIAGSTELFVMQALSGG